MTRLLALTLLTLCAAPLCAQDAAPKSTADQLIDKIADLRKQQTDLRKQEETAVNDLKTELKRLTERIDKLGLTVPTPKPPEPPAPVDPLRAKLKAAYDGDSAQLDIRRGQALDLAALYRQAAKLSADPALGTAGELLERVRAAAGSLVGADALKDVRRAVATELGKVFPADGDLTDAQRTAAADLFGKLAAHLEEIAK